MIGEGDAAPEFSLPAVVDGAFEEVALTDYLGDDIVILAFYPADFNPACSEEETDLDELDLFTMQKDVSILGIAADSVYSHRAFANEYDLHIPLLADVHADVAADYGVAVDEPNAGYLTNRAVIVIDPDGEVQYAWQTEKLKRLPPVEDVREAVDGIGGASTAAARYRVGHAHYVEGRRAFTKAMNGFSEMEWMMAQSDFTRAKDEFEEAEDQFDTAVRFAEDETPRTYFERAERKAQALWQAAEWLAESASAYASGEGARGQEMRTDAESPLETARDIHEPPDPDDFPPEEDPANRDEQEETVLPSADTGPPPSLEADIDESAEPPETEALADEMRSKDTESVATDTVTATEQTADAESGSGDDESSEADDEREVADEIDDEELEEIAAELEEQTKQANAKHAREVAAADEESDDDSSRTVEESPIDDSETVEPGADSAPGESASSPGGTGKQREPVSDSDKPDAENVEGELDEDDIELDLADPTDGDESASDEAGDGEDEADEGENGESEEPNSGNHGVPDSL
ncbi:redoxin domain-containing protein [Salinibaculum salinum]|uniref:redoxin domain-containing protein n=1 Tax=Salinibaculum salinum TaxID=3131996 RepID=UPI0030EEF05B